MEAHGTSKLLTAGLLTPPIVSLTGLTWVAPATSRVIGPVIRSLLSPMSIQGEVGSQFWGFIWVVARIVVPFWVP